MKIRFVLVLMSSFGCSLAVAAPDKPAAAHATEAQKLPLDHGPHAVTTPWLNQQRLAAQAAARQAPPSGLAGVSKNP